VTTFSLLTGAGFTRNWGGPLVGEVFNWLIADPGMSPALRKRLWDAEDRGGYEDLLDKLQQSNSAEDKADLRLLETTLLGMFNQLKYVMKSKQLDFANNLDTSVTMFLSRFDAIFTLNQDVFLETHYTPALGRRHGFGPAGVKVFRNEEPPLYAPADKFSLPDPRFQPYLKMHGSMNFLTTGDGKGLPIIVAGGRKAAAIEREPLLRWYRDRFIEYLSRPDSRLMVIGYSFGDPHINAIIEKAVEGGLKLFIIDPLGASVLDKRDSRAQITQPKSAQQQTLEGAVIGGSKRLMREIFGDDEVEWHSMMQFFG